jgi:arabinosaccharide transport system substrate-binding protein
VTFHLGKPIAVMLAIALASGVFLLARPAPSRSSIVLWTFAESHARSFRGDASTPTTQPTLVELFRQRTGQSVDIKLISLNALNLRLNTFFDRGVGTEEIPDLVEIEISSIGQYFRPPLDLVGLLPLNDYIEKSGWKPKLVAARLAPWTKQGKIFGVPHDVHPVTITYRKDLFDQAGVDLASAKTWPEFHAVCIQFRDYWDAQKKLDPSLRARYPIEASRNNVDIPLLMLMQQHINLLDTNLKTYFTDPRVARTLVFYAKMVAGPDAIAGTANPGPNVWANDFAAGNLAAIVTPDWRAGYLPKFGPDAAGKARMMPLPVFDVAIGIPRNSKNPDRAWQLIELLYLSPEGQEARKTEALILPPVRTAWNDPLWHQADPYYGGQKVGELYIELAEKMPLREVTPFTVLAQQMLTNVLGQTVAEVDAGRVDGLEARVQQWLKEADDELKRRIEFNSFEGSK